MNQLKSSGLDGILFGF